MCVQEVPAEVSDIKSPPGARIIGSSDLPNMHTMY